MKNTKKYHIALFSIIWLFQTASSQSTETLIYIKNDLIAERKELQKKIDAIAIKLKDIERKLLQSKENYQQVNYLEKSNSRTTNGYQSSFQNKKTSSSISKGRTYNRGPRGGCYYVNSKGNKSYVSRSMCN